jgi:hypothetical protein
MEASEQQQKYLSMAAEADKLAVRSASPWASDNWQSVAESYRALAKAIEKARG